MASRNHASKRTSSEWVTWANGEGFIDIVEHAPNAETHPGLHPMPYCVADVFFPIGRVYCSLYATSIAAWHAFIFRCKLLQNGKRLKLRMDQFPKLAPVAIAYLLSPQSAAQAERSFSLLGHTKEHTSQQHHPVLSIQSTTSCRFAFNVSQKGWKGVLLDSSKPRSALTCRMAPSVLLHFAI